MKKEPIKTEMKCFSTINETTLNEILVGVEFMKSFYTVFDLDHDTVGLAESSANDRMNGISKKK